VPPPPANAVAGVPPARFQGRHHPYGVKGKGKGKGHWQLYNGGWQHYGDWQGFKGKGKAGWPYNRKGENTWQDINDYNWPPKAKPAAAPAPVAAPEGPLAQIVFNFHLR
jgi:hypothetical protein